MEDLDWLMSISSDVPNIKISEELRRIPSICGLCRMIRSLVAITLMSPDWEILSTLVSEENFVIGEDRTGFTTFRIDVAKNHTKFNEYALYKKPGFDAAFKSMKVLKPKLTEFDFVFTCGFDIDGTDTHDEDLADQRIYHGDSDCIHDDDGSVYTFSGIDRESFTVESVVITISPDDIRNNRDILRKIISSHKTTQCRRTPRRVFDRSQT